MLDERKKGSRKASKSNYSVFEITSKVTGKKHYLISSRYTLENVLGKVHSYSSSSTVGGGNKEIADDMDQAGKDIDTIKKKFTVKQIAAGATKEKAEEIKADYVRGTGKVYNQQIDVS